MATAKRKQSASTARGKTVSTSRTPAGGVGLVKCPSGIEGLDEITSGGLPRGRPTLVCGAAGTGKTLFASQFLVKGATDYGEPGVFMCFEETEQELVDNVASLGFDLPTLVDQKKIMLDFVRVERHEIEETGEYDLEGLFVRIDYAIQQIGARRIVLDTLESLFSGLQNQSILRAEFRRLFRWLKDKGVTAIVTAEAGDEGRLTRQGMEEYVSDCVIFLDHRVAEHVTTRRMRVVKYRGSTHGTNEYPFLIGKDGIAVMPVTSLTLDHEAPSERVSSGLERLDHMLGGKGFYRASSVLLSGTAGTGKSTIAATFIDAACRRGEKALYFAFEESQAQIIRNMRSIGLNLQQWVDSGHLKFFTARPAHYGLEMHLATMLREVQRFAPDVVVADPITNFFTIGTGTEVRSMLTRLIDFLKGRKITGLLTSLTPGGGAIDLPEVGISSLIDSWILLRDVEVNGERNRLLHLLKSRGMPHSNQVREFLITSNGIDLIDVYTGPGGVLTGSARTAQEARERVEEASRQNALAERQMRLEQQKQSIQSHIASLQAEASALQLESERVLAEERGRVEALTARREEMSRRRHADRIEEENGKRAVRSRRGGSQR